MSKVDSGRNRVDRRWGRHCSCLLYSVHCLLSLVGCTTERIPTYPPMLSGEAIKVLADRSSAIHTVSAQGLITLTRDTGDTVRLDAAIVLQPPTRARLRAWKFGRAVFDMTLTPEGLWLIAPAESDRRKEIMSTGANIGNLTREWLRLITGALDAGSIASETDGKLVLKLPRENGSTMLCQIDRKTLTPRRYDLKDSSGVARFTLTLNCYTDIGGIVWPREIKAMSPTGQVLIELHDVEINGEIPTAAFRPPARAEKVGTYSPSSGTPGEGRGGGASQMAVDSELRIERNTAFPSQSSALSPQSYLANPHPNPPPEYRRRGREER